MLFLHPDEIVSQSNIFSKLKIYKWYLQYSFLLELDDMKFGQNHLSQRFVEFLGNFYNYIEISN